MNDQEAYEFYADPENRRITGAGRKRQGARLTSMSSIRFHPEVIDAVRDASSREGVTVGSWIRRLVGRELAKSACRARPAGLIPGSGVAGEPRALPSPLRPPRVFRCPHMTIGNVAAAECATCGPMTPQVPGAAA